MRRLLTVFTSLSLALAANAIDADKAFDDPAMQARYENLIAEVRCLVCQNQTIKDSNALLASDLRREIRRMMEDGMSDAEIADFLVERYGDFVLYNPRKSGRTLILWVAPALFIGLGAIVLVRILRKRMVMSIDDEAEELPS